MRAIRMSGSMRGCGNGATAKPLRHRQTKGAATDMLNLKPPRHTPTLRIAVVHCVADVRLVSAFSRQSRLCAKRSILTSDSLPRLSEPSDITRPFKNYDISFRFPEICAGFPRKRTIGISHG